MRTAGSLVVIGVTVATLVGCSQSLDGTAQGAPPDPIASASAETPAPPAPADVMSIEPCELLTHAEAEKLTRTPLDEGVVSPSTDTPGCRYTAPTTGPTAQVELYAGPGAKKYFDIDNDLSPRPELPGLADEAYTHGDSYRVYFRKGSIWVVLGLVRLEDDPHYMKTLISLAHTIADRLPAA